MGRSAPKSLSSLSLGPERKCKCYNGYFVNGYVFHTEEYGQGRKTYNSGVCVKGSTSSELEVDYYGRLEEVVELQYHNEQNIVFLFKCYWYDTTDRGIRVDPHYGLVEINSKARLRNINDVFVFAKQCQQVYYTYTPSLRKDRSRVDWLSVLKTKPQGRVEVVQDENEDTNVRDEVFQVSELVEPYRVAPSIELEENSNFYVSMIVLLIVTPSRAERGVAAILDLFRGLFCVKGSPPSIMATRKPNWSFRDSKARDWLRKGKVLAPLVRPT
jgi:hypothetical protein